MRFVFWVIVLTIYYSASVHSAAHAARSIKQEDHWQAEREQYRAAMTALAKGRSSDFVEISKQLSHYPLYPYLEYAYLKHLIKRKTPVRQVRAFLEAYADTPLAPQVTHHWLRTLAKRGRWTDYLSFYYEGIRSAELQCYHLWALYKTGSEKAALEKTASLWLVGHSQPKACDPIFKLWIDRGQLTNHKVWQRFSMALQSGNTQLARYLIRFMSKRMQQQARLYRELYFKPERLDSTRYARLLEQENQDLNLHLLKRLARRDAIAASIVWEKLQQQHHFDQVQKQQTDFHIIRYLAQQDHQDQYKTALQEYPYPDDTSLLQAGIEMAIRQQNWTWAVNKLERLPEPTLKRDRWQYWYARALEQTATVSVRWEDILTDLARSRSYYGFLAADWLGTDYQLNAESYSIDGNFLEQFKRDAGVERALELWRLGDHHFSDARREWSWATRNLSREQYYSAAFYAHSIGWHSQAITSAVQGEVWNDLKLRFPVIYNQPVSQMSRKLRLEKHWLYAIARQESAMTQDARSHKGALGLMQLMPSTAAMVGKKHGIRYRNQLELIDPELNIVLASHYLKDLLDRFDGNTIHSTAAYNAGPHRVSGWLQNHKNLPVDVWIESIPYAETRQYVKNVLTYSVIFARLQSDHSFYMPTAAYLGHRSTALASAEVGK